MIPSRGIGGIEKRSSFPQLPDKAWPRQAYPGGPLGHQWAQWHQSHGWQGSPDSHVGHGVQGGHPAEGLGDHKDTHCGGGGQEGEADLFMYYSDRLKLLTSSCMQLSKPNPAHDST